MAEYTQTDDDPFGFIVPFCQIEPWQEARLLTCHFFREDEFLDDPEPFPFSSAPPLDEPSGIAAHYVTPIHNSTSQQAEDICTHNVQANLSSSDSEGAAAARQIDLRLSTETLDKVKRYKEVLDCFLGSRKTVADTEIIDLSREEDSDEDPGSRSNSETVGSVKKKCDLTKQLDSVTDGENHEMVSMRDKPIGDNRVDEGEMTYGSSAGGLDISEDGGDGFVNRECLLHDISVEVSEVSGREKMRKYENDDVDIEDNAGRKWKHRRPSPDTQRKRKLPTWMMETEKNDNKRMNEAGKSDAAEKAEIKGGLMSNLDQLRKFCQILDGEDNRSNKEVDFLETARQRGVTFPRPRWWPSEGEKRAVCEDNRNDKEVDFLETAQQQRGVTFPQPR